MITNDQDQYRSNNQQSNHKTQHLQRETKVQWSHEGWLNVEFVCAKCTTEAMPGWGWFSRNALITSHHIYIFWLFSNQNVFMMSFVTSISEKSRLYSRSISNKRLEKNEERVNTFFYKLLTFHSRCIQERIFQRVSHNFP